MCPCGYNNECSVWCGNGHRNGKCPPYIANNDVTPNIKLPPHCSVCYELAPYGDERNVWINVHTSRLHRGSQYILHKAGLNGRHKKNYEILKKEAKRVNKIVSQTWTYRP